MNNASKFVVKLEDDEGHSFILVDVAGRSPAPAFDHESVAGQLSAILKTDVAPFHIPIGDCYFSPDDRELCFYAFGFHFQINLETGNLRGDRLPQFEAGAAIAPDKSCAAYIQDHNLWIQDFRTGKRHRLTKDGGKYFEYGKIPDAANMQIARRRAGVRPAAQVVWSPDSKKLIVQRVDERDVKELPFIQAVPDDGSPRPVLYTSRHPLPGDAHVATSDLFIVDVASRKLKKIGLGPQPSGEFSPIERGFVWWSKDAKHVYVIEPGRADTSMKFHEVNGRTGSARKVLEESGETYIELNLDFMGNMPNVRVLEETGEIIWYSERSGWGHLYLYDLKSGRLKRAITSGDWVALTIIHLDEQNRTLLVSGAGKEPGRDPYYRHLYRVHLDTGDIQLLTPEDSHHTVYARPGTGVSPDGSYFVDTYSRIAEPAQTVVRSGDGDEVLRLPSCDVDALIGDRFRWPIPFKVKAADGETDIYGALYLPPDFDERKTYPVIDLVYPGPQRIRTSKSSFTPEPWELFGFAECLAMAELGFAVVTIDGRGTPFRSKAFHDYHRLEGAGGLEDHVAGIRQLAERYSFLDVERVGISGFSQGGYASARAILEYPDFFKVAVASAGPYNLSGCQSYWCEKYQGIPRENEPYEKVSLLSLAPRLKGKLFLMTADLDEHANPGLTLQLVDELIKAQKTFEMLVLPNRDHFFFLDPYYTRRRWDYLVTHLLGVEPPGDVALSEPKGMYELLY